jgi:hypothetical protein
MNPLINLTDKKFNELTANELIQVIQAYCDQNNYEFDYKLDYKNKKDIEYYFTSNFYPLFYLEIYFDYWIN